MVTQNCPRCASNRIRRGYRPTPFWSKILFRYNLLCDKCNWEFSGFAVPGTVSTKASRKRKRVEDAAENARRNSLDNTGETEDETDAADQPETRNEEKKNKPKSDSPNQRSEKRVRIKL